MRKAVCMPVFLEDLMYWVGNDPRVAERVLKLVDATLRNPHSGIGKPEPLRHVAAKLWSRRITLEHRLVYEERPGEIVFHQARYHY